jgi:hypothetical protein
MHEHKREREEQEAHHRREGAAVPLKDYMDYLSYLDGFA